jgi:hypothetical protein
MSTELSTSVSLPAIFNPRPLTGSLAYHVAGERSADGHLSPIHGSPSQRDVAEANARLGEYEHHCRPGDPRLIAAWLGRLCSLPGAPGTQQATQAAAVALVTACGDLPAAVWTAATVALALQHEEWFPPPAKVRKLLLPIAEGLWRTLDGLRRVARPPEDQGAPSRPDQGQDAQAHVADIVKAFVSERTWHDSAPGAKPKVNPAYLSDGQLLAAYEAAGQHERAEFIRRKIAAGS